MGFRLGNLSTQEVCSRLGITLTEEEVKSLEAIRCQRADGEIGKWHAFDLPFGIACRDVQTAITVRDIYAKYSKEMIDQLSIWFDQKATDE